MNTVFSIAYVLAVLTLLLGAVVIGELTFLRTPAGVLMLFGAGLFMSLGFLLFGHVRFDEAPSDDAEENPLRP